MTHRSGTFRFCCEASSAPGHIATRGPKRINPIGLSLIQVLDVAGSAIRFAGVDLVDGTPVIDLKPYVPRNRNRTDGPTVRL